MHTIRNSGLFPFCLRNLHRFFLQLFYMKPTEYPQLRIKDIICESAKAKTFVFEKPKNLSYQAGQFITFLFSDNKEGRRAYSFSSAPETDDDPAVTVRRIANGLVSRQLIDHYKIGDRLHYSHISGHFTLPEKINDDQHFIFFAAGSGITPVFSLIKSLLIKSHCCRITLFYSSHSEADTLFAEALKSMQSQHVGRLIIEWLYSINTNKKQRRLSHFLLLQFIEKYVQKQEDTLFYLCGPFDYMDMIQIVLRTEGIALQKIRQEHFYIPRLAKAPEPPDTMERTVQLRLGGKNYQFPSKYPQSILDTALAHGIPLDFSCRSGQCGSCVAKCTQGKVWMRYNEVLTEDDLKNGLVLTCNGFPIDGPVVLEK